MVFSTESAIYPHSYAYGDGDRDSSHANRHSYGDPSYGNSHGCAAHPHGDRAAPYCDPNEEAHEDPNGYPDSHSCPTDSYTDHSSHRACGHAYSHPHDSPPD